VVHLFYAPDGTPVDAAMRGSLGLTSICIRKTPPLPSARSQEDLLIAAGKRDVQSFAGAKGTLEIDPSAEPLAVALVWVKQATGRLQFTIGDHSALLPFHGWAAALSPPPFVCPHSGNPTYHIAATDDGRIVAAEAIETCARSGRRVLTSELSTCSVTGQRVLPQFTRPCPISGQRALEDQFGVCGRCRQQVTRVVMRRGVCAGCRSLAAVAADDPRVIWLVSEYPRLGRWKRWKLSETAAFFIAQGATLWRQLLLVMDKETLAPLYAAARGRLRKAWYPLDPTEHQELFAPRPAGTVE
jgi:hypothetical protein